VWRLTAISNNLNLGQKRLFLKPNSNFFLLNFVFKIVFFVSLGTIEYCRKNGKTNFIKFFLELMKVREGSEHKSLKINDFSMKITKKDRQLF